MKCTRLYSALLAASTVVLRDELNDFGFWVLGFVLGFLLALGGYDAIISSTRVSQGRYYRLARGLTDCNNFDIYVFPGMYEVVFVTKNEVKVRSLLNDIEYWVAGRQFAEYSNRSYVPPSELEYQAVLARVKNERPDDRVA